MRLIQMAAAHDWDWRMSDDPRTLERGQEVENAIREESSKYTIQQIEQALEKIKSKLTKLNYETRNGISRRRDQNKIV